MILLSKMMDSVADRHRNVLRDLLCWFTLHLHLDNDEVGRGTAKGIIGGLSDTYTVLDEPPAPGCKDVNDQLMKLVQIRKKEEYDR